MGFYGRLECGGGDFAWVFMVVCFCCCGWLGGWLGFVFLRSITYECVFFLTSLLLVVLFTFI